MSSLGGRLAGVANGVSERVIALVVAFIAGGVLNGFNEERPASGSLSSGRFAGGAPAYTALLQPAA